MRIKGSLAFLSLVSALICAVAFTGDAHGDQPDVPTGDQIGGILVGVDYLPINRYSETASGVYKLQRPGFALGILIPIRLPVLGFYYKVKASTHAIASRDWNRYNQTQRDESALYDRHASLVNEILMGKNIPMTNQTSIMPLIGIGYQLDALNQDGDSPVVGIVYSCLYADMAAMARYRFEGFGVGVLANYQMGILPSWEGYEATDRLSLAMVLFK